MKPFRIAIQTVLVALMLAPLALTTLLFWAFIQFDQD